MPRLLFLTLSLLTFTLPWAASAQPVDYDEAVDGDLEFIEGVGYTVTVTVAPGTNTVSGVLGFDGADDDADIDPFYLIVPDGQQIESIEFDYTTTILANPGRAGYTFYLDSVSGGATIGDERVEATEVLSESREFYADLMPLGPGRYGLGRPGSSRTIDMIFEVAYTWTIVVSGDDPGPIVLDVPEVLANDRPAIDGDLAVGEWDAARRLDIENGFLAFAHDRRRLYVLIDMLADDGDDPFRAGGGDQFWLTFDVDRDGAITPGVDRRYRPQSGTGNLRYETFCDDCLFDFDPPASQTYSARGEGFGCFLADGTASLIPLGCDSHRVWEVAIDLAEIGLDGDQDIRMGWLVASGTPLLSENVPPDLLDVANYAQLTLEGTARSLSDFSDFETGQPKFEVTQAIQTPDNDSDLAAGKPTAVRVWSSVESDASDSYVDGQRNGIDLPGSPLYRFGSLSKYDDPASSRNTTVRIIQLPPSWAEGGTVDFGLRLRHPDGSTAEELDDSVHFAPTRVPVFWTVPVRNTATNGTFTLATDAQIDTHEQAALGAAPIREIEFVRRPILDVQNITSSAGMKTQLKTYDQQVLLAWTLGLLLTGELPFTLPEQITGFLSQGFGIGGSSDRIGKGGDGRITWVNANIAAARGTYAHELNHNLDAKTTSTWGLHSGGCNASSGGPLDPSWPYPNFTIQEVGVFWNGMNFRTVSDQTFDLMSYCSVNTVPNQWFTPYRWDAWLDVFRTDLVQAKALTLAAEDTPVPVDSFYVLGRIFPDGSGELGQVLRQPGLPRFDGPLDGYSVRVLDCDRGVLAEDPFTVSLVGDEGEEFEHAAFDAVVAAPPDACSLVLAHEGETLDERVLSADVPLVDLVSPGDGEVWEGDVTVRWQAEDADDLTFVLLYSPDGGLTWQPLASGLTGDEVTLDSTQVPGSDDARLRILATDGANTGEDDSEPFRVVAKPPRVIED